MQWIDKTLGTDIHLSVASDRFIYRGIRNWLFDFLWAYSLMSAVILLCGADYGNRRLIIGAVATFEILMELSQLLPGVRGTYDIFDLIVEMVANVLAIKKFSGGDRNEKE